MNLMLSLTDRSAVRGRLLRRVATTAAAGAAAIAAIPADRALALVPGNVVANASFESDLDGWSSWQSSIGRSWSSAAPDGDYVARVARTTGTSYVIDDAPAAVGDTVAGRRYTATAFVRAAAGQSVGRPIGITLRERSPSGSVVAQTTSSAQDLGAGFQEITVTARAVGSGNTLDVRISQGSAVAGDVFEADAVTVVPEGAGAQADQPPPSSGNLTANPSFEDGLDGWISWQGEMRRLGPYAAPDGEYAVRVSRSSGGSYTLSDSPPSVEMTLGGATYRATALVRAANAGTVGKPALMILRERDASGSVVAQTRSDVVTLTGAFQTIEVDAVARTEGGTLDVRISQGSAGAGDAFDADMITIEQTTGVSAPPAQPSAESPPQAAPEPAPQPEPTGLPAPELLPYDRAVLFNQRIDGLAPHPRSASIAANIARNVRVSKVNASFGAEVPTVYIGSSSDPIYTVTVDGRTERIRMPRDARPGSGTDHPLVVLNPAHPDHGRDVELRVWRASIDHAGRRIFGEGTGLFHYNNDGARLNPDGSRSASVPFSGSGTGSGLSFTAGLVRPADISSGRIRHSIRIALGCNDFTNAFRAPAVKTDQNATRCGGSDTPSSQKVDMGTRLRLPASVDCDRRLAPVAPGRTESTRETRFLRILCRGIQEYGLIVLDGAPADRIVIYMENDETADWEPVAGQPLYGSYGYVVRDSTTPSDGLTRDSRHGIPWGSLESVN